MHLALRNCSLNRKGKHYVGIYYTYQTRDWESIEHILWLSLLRPDPTDRDFLYPFGSSLILLFTAGKD